MAFELSVPDFARNAKMTAVGDVDMGVHHVGMIHARRGQNGKRIVPGQFVLAHGIGWNGAVHLGAHLS